MTPERQIRAAYQRLADSYTKRRAAAAGVAELARVSGVPFVAIAGPEMPARLEVADSVAGRLFAAARALDSGAAVLVPWRGDFAIIPRAAVEPYRAAARVLGHHNGTHAEDEDETLGVWPVWLIAGAIVAGVIVVALVAYTILEVTQASAQNEAAARDLHGKAAAWLAGQIAQHPERAQQIADAFNRGMESFEPGGGAYGDNPPASPWSIGAAAGGAGLAVGALLALFALSRTGSSSRRGR